MPSSPSETSKSASIQSHQHSASSCDDPTRLSSMTASSSSSSTPTSNGHTVSMSSLKSSGQSHTSDRHSPLACNAPSSLSTKNSRLNSSPPGPGPAGHSKSLLTLHHSRRIPSPSHRKSLSPQSASLASSAHPVSPLLMNGTSAINSPSSHTLSGLSSDHPTSTQAGVLGYTISNSNCARQLTKLKRLLETLHKFASDTSPEMGKRVHGLIIALVGGQLLLEDFHYKIQEATRYPLRSYVIQFLRLNLPLLQGDLLRGARASRTSLIQYVHQNEALIFDSSSSSLTDISHGEAFDIFQPEVMWTRKETSLLNSHKIPGESLGKRENVITPLDERSSGEPPSKRHSAGLGGIGTNLAPNNMALLHVQPPASTPRQHLVTSHYLPHLPLRRTIVDDISTSSSAPSSSTPQYFHSLHTPTISDSRTTSSGPTNPEHYLDRVYSLNDLYEKDMMTNNRPISHSLHPITLHRTVGDDAMTADMDDEWQNVHSMIHHITFLLDRTKKSLASLQSRFIELASAKQLVPSPTTVRNRNMNFPPPPLDSNSHLRPVDQPGEQRKSRDQPIPNSYLTENSTKSQISNEVKRIPTAVGRPLTNGIKDINRQQVADLQKAIVADNKASELVAVERAKMEKMITEARRQATEEALASINRQENSEENCWNCGRKASETCSGCNVARYCGSFCQHKDWENHHRVCGTGRDIANNGTISDAIDSPSHTPASDLKRKHKKTSADGTNDDDKARTVNGDTREVSD